MTHFSRLGAEHLRTIINDFVDRMFEDTMIGFFFRNADRDRIKEMEYQFTAQFLGSESPYEGRPIRAAHAPHHIMGGQFDRRSQLLREAIARHDVPDDIRDAWMAHVESLRSTVTAQAPGECD